MHAISKTALPVIMLISFDLQAITFDDLSVTPSSDIQVIDCRSSNNYNGWPEAEAKRGGHFPGAINIDADWLKSIEPAQFRQLLSEKKVMVDKPTYIYCDNAASALVSSALKEQGLTTANIIDQPINLYSGQLDALPRFQQLVTPEWVKQVVEGQQPHYAPKKGYKLVEVAWGPPTKYLASHIPTALYLNTNEIESEPWWNRVSDEKLAKVIRELGIRYDTTVILYGRNNMAAARAANIMMYAGVEDVRLLNGGWKAWVNAGYVTEPMLKSNTTPVDFGRKIPANPDLIIDIPEAKAMLDKAPDTQSLVSIRTWDEYIGNTSGYKYIEPKGRITGSKWGHAGSDANHLEDFRNPDDTMKSAKDIENLWQQWNINQSQQVSFYCGTGWRASETFFYAYVMGWKNISVFDGGWFEWSGDKANPTSTGDISDKK
ncbi:rhodanese-like domain-containing protein [Photobacterium lipolyticum]|uniref:Sulfurtransferase n=1 Tax=Photobacterium lipolyticum TaxID=266810 RepID=A0A2T3N0H1_9GAMM|nr:rhodanese-like domain-containing protein [Photobacterium lipolyticum]PSW05762.1 sulfurtransferase [Photobacterium lipolyticum]